jgi:16S rRNA (cytosine1402-N4)-methyltransferase
MPYPQHTPVMVYEVLHYLAPQPGARIVDATVGLGGHAVAILDRIGPSGNLIGIDRDPAALAIAGERLAARCREWRWPAPDLFTLHPGNFRDLSTLLRETGGPPVDGILLDLGVSSLQLDQAGRGFSFREEGPLDMRMDPGAPVTAASLVNELPDVDLARILWEFGEERFSRRIARRIVERRAGRPLATTRELAELVAGVYPPGARHGRIHPATRTFQALRIGVNDELASLETALRDVADPLAPGGRLVVLSYHSLEDRIVKRAFEFLSGRCRCPPELPACACEARAIFRIVTRKPITPSNGEIALNPRARSAKLRAAERRGARGSGD